VSNTDDGGLQKTLGEQRVQLALGAFVERCCRFVQE
jgi:hypothetical protein